MHDLEIEDGKVVVRGVPDKGITLASIGKKGNLYMSKVEPVIGASHPAFSVQAPAFCGQLAQLSDTVTGVIVFIRAQGDPLVAGNPLRHGHSRLTLGRPRRLRHAGIDDQAMPILHEHMPQIRQFGLLSLGLFVQAGLRVGP